MGERTPTTGLGRPGNGRAEALGPQGQVLFDTNRHIHFVGIGGSA